MFIILIFKIFLREYCVVVIFRFIDVDLNFLWGFFFVLVIGDKYVILWLKYEVIIFSFYDLGYNGRIFI